MSLKSWWQCFRWGHDFEPTRAQRPESPRVGERYGRRIHLCRHCEAVDLGDLDYMDWYRKQIFQDAVANIKARNRRGNK